MSGVLITPEYLALQRDLHARYDYGHGADVRDCLVMIGRLLAPGASVLDYGCGQGRFRALAKDFYTVTEYDPAIPGKDQAPEPADGVVCADVLEHVEPECIDAVLDDLRRVMLKFGVLIIATQPSRKIMADGRQAHVLLRDDEWWREKLNGRFTILESRDRSDEGRGLVYVVKPRQDHTDEGGVHWNEIGEIRTVMAVPEDVRMDHTAANCARVPGRITLEGVDIMPPHDRVAVLVCYGPSLRDSWPHLLTDHAPDRDIVTVSAAHDFVTRRKITPYAHIECDPRPHKAAQMGEPVEGVNYWLASCVAPEMLDKLEGHKVKLWHAYNGEATRRHIGEIEPRQRVVVGGGSVGLRALSLLYYLGYRDFIIHGMDLCFSEDGEQHAGPHAGNPMKSIPVLLGGRTFSTSPALVSYFRQFFTQWQAMSGVSFTLFGDGLLQHALRGHVHERFASN